MSSEPVVYAVDDDPLVLRTMRSLLGVAGLEIETFDSGRLFLEGFDPERPSCLVLDLNMPEMNGFEIQKKLASEGVSLPIIFLTAYGNVSNCAQAFKSGAFDFLEKPADAKSLVTSIRQALDEAQARRHQNVPWAPPVVVRPELTPREHEVMELLVDGKTLKQIASELQITIQTAAKHRTRVLEKFDVANDVELVRRVLELPALEEIDGPPF